MLRALIRSVSSKAISLLTVFALKIASHFAQTVKATEIVKKEYLVLILEYFFLFRNKKHLYVVGTH